jgi:hypothetical protein
MEFTEKMLKELCDKAKCIGIIEFGGSDSTVTESNFDGITIYYDGEIGAKFIKNNECGCCSERIVSISLADLNKSMDQLQAEQVEVIKKEEEAKIEKHRLDKIARDKKAKEEQIRKDKREHELYLKLHERYKNTQEK